MNLCVNVGNCSVILGLFENGKLKSPLRIPNKKIIDLKLVLPDRKVSHIIISSVVPSKNEVFSLMMKSVYRITPKFITPRLIKDAYSSMGTDRVANLLGGKKLKGLPVCVIDFGTATTIDVLGKDNKYKGGLIMPGLEMGAMALHELTALLPAINLGKIDDKKLLNKSTKKCMESGIYNGEYFRIKGAVTEIKNKTNPKFVITGGAGKRIASLLKFEYNPWLALYGLDSISI